MARRMSICFFLSLFIVASCFLGLVDQVMAETWKYRIFDHATKMEAQMIPDAAGHFVGLQIREGVTIFENGELAWHKTVAIFDGVKGAGPYSRYMTTTFQDGSTMTNYAKGTSFPGGYNWTAEIIHGTGRFQGIKGTITGTGKFLPTEKGEISGKAVGEGTITFSLPSK